jgi:lysine-specific demethylase/histidyl-hydroxylase NO66
VVARRAAEHFADRSHDGAHAARAARRLRGRVWSGNRPESLRPLRQAAAVHALGPDSVVRLRHGLRHRVVPPAADGAPLRLELPDRTVELPAAAATPLAALLDGSPVRLGETPEDEPGDAAVVVRRLLTEGVLVTPGSAGDASEPEGGVPDGHTGTTDT